MSVDAALLGLSVQCWGLCWCAIAVAHASQSKSSCVCSAITGTLQAGCLVLQAFGSGVLSGRLCAQTSVG